MVGVDAIEKKKLDYIVVEGEMVTTSNMLTTLKRIDMLPLKNNDVRFSNNIWNLSFIDKFNEKKYSGEFDFSKINYSYRDTVKCLIFKYIALENIAISTITAKYSKACNFIEFLSNKKIYSGRLITLNLIIEFLDTIIGLETYKNSYKSVIVELLKLIESNDEDISYSNIFRNFKQNRKTKELKEEKEAGKIPEIPPEIFSTAISCAIKDLDNPQCNKDEKIQAAIILILSQTGIRIGELRLLKYNSIEEFKIFEDDEPIYNLNYTCPKSKKKDAKSFLTGIGVKAYKYLNSFAKDDKTKEYIFTDAAGENLWCSHNLSVKIFKFFATHREELNCLNRKKDDVKGFSFVPFHKTTKTGLYLTNECRKGLNEKDIICYPTAHQFRVSVCNNLLRQGINIDWVREHMNHLNAEITNHYIRSEGQSAKNKEFAKSVLKSVIQDDYRLLGKDKDILMNKINEFIKNNNFNIKEDIDAIIEQLACKIPIRQKGSGYCIKSAFGRKCTHDGFTDSVYCAFGLCPNHFVIYKMIDITYKNFKDLQQTIKYNINNGFQAQASIELNKLKRVINEGLIEEIKELKYEIIQKGKENIIKEEPNLTYFIDNVEYVQSEVEKWKDIKIEEIALNMKT